MMDSSAASCQYRSDQSRNSSSKRCPQCHETEWGGDRRATLVAAADCNESNDIQFFELLHHERAGQNAVASCRSQIN